MNFRSFMYINYLNSCVACDVLKSENVMLVDKIKQLENELKDSKEHLKKFYSDKMEIVVWSKA